MEPTPGQFPKKDIAGDLWNILSPAPKAEESNPGKEKLVEMMKGVNAPMTTDEHGTVHVDLSDPNHPFWKGNK